MLDNELGMNGKQEPSTAAEPDDVPVLRVDIRSQCAETALQYAQEEAVESGSRSISSHHVLIGLARAEGCVAQALLEAGGHTAATLRRNAAFVLAAAEQDPPDEPGWSTPRVSRVLENAALEAGQRGHALLGTLHLLHGMIREREGVAVILLEAPGVGLELIGTAIARAFRENPADPT